MDPQQRVLRRGAAVVAVAVEVAEAAVEAVAVAVQLAIAGLVVPLHLLLPHPCQAARLCHRSHRLWVDFPRMAEEAALAGPAPIMVDRQPFLSLVVVMAVLVLLLVVLVLLVVAALGLAARLSLPTLPQPQVLVVVVRLAGYSVMRRLPTQPIVGRAATQRLQCE